MADPWLEKARELARKNAKRKAEEPVPRSALEVIHDKDGPVVSIKWEQARVASSKFPDPLITVDYALDERPIGVVLAGSKAQQLIDALAESES